MSMSPCPKCHRNCDVELVSDRNYKGMPVYHVECYNCGTKVEVDCEDPAEAIRMWNACEVKVSDKALYDIYTKIGFYKHFYVWADSKIDAEEKIVESVENGEVIFTDIAPGSLSFNNWGVTTPNYDPECYQRDVLNPEEAVEEIIFEGNYWNIDRTLVTY